MSDVTADKVFIESKGNSQLNQYPLQRGKGTHSEPAIYCDVTPQIHTFQTVGVAQVTKDLYFFAASPRAILVELRAVAMEVGGAAAWVSVTRAGFRTQAGVAVPIGVLWEAVSQERHSDLPLAGCALNIATALSTIQAQAFGMAGKTINWTLVSQIVVAS